MLLSLDQLKLALPQCRAPEKFIAPVNTALAAAQANTRASATMFLATVAHESGDLNVFEENLNYGADALQRVWPSHFPTVQSAMTYARQPEKIANRVYALRMGNGAESSGDGWRTRGAGAIQITGTANHTACARFFGRPPDAAFEAWLRSPEGAMLSAAWFWQTRACGDYAEHDDFDGVCDIVNIGRKTSAQGDAVGFINRLARLRAIRFALKDWK